MELRAGDELKAEVGFEARAAPVHARRRDRVELPLTVSANAELAAGIRMGTGMADSWENWPAPQSVGWRRSIEANSGAGG